MWHCLTVWRRMRQGKRQWADSKPSEITLCRPPAHTQSCYRHLGLNSGSWRFEASPSAGGVYAALQRQADLSLTLTTHECSCKTNSGQGSEIGTCFGCTSFLTFCWVLEWLSCSAHRYTRAANHMSRPIVLRPCT